MAKPPSGSGAIIRIERARGLPYKTITTVFAQDERLSWGARGMLVYLLSKSNNWKVNTSDLISQSPEGRHAVYTILKELASFGYLQRRREQGEGGKFVWSTVVYDVPQPSDENQHMVSESEAVPVSAPEQPYAENRHMAEPYADFPDTDKPDTEEPYTENRHIYLRENIPTKELTKNRINAAAETRARENGGGGVVEFFRSHDIDDRKIETMMAACGEKLTPEYLARWQAVIDCPPRGMETAVGTMIARLSRGEFTLPRTGTSSNGHVPAPVLSPQPADAPASREEARLRGAERKAAALARLNEPVVKESTNG